jgi:hypothetical protein
MHEFNAFPPIERLRDDPRLAELPGKMTPAPVDAREISYIQRHETPSGRRRRAD